MAPSREITLGKETVGGITANDFPRHYHDPSLDQETAWNLEGMRKHIACSFNSQSKLAVSFDLVGIDPSIANALRRILLAELPTMAIEEAWFSNNTSILQDEVLAHRLGLVPIKVDPEDFDYYDAQQRLDLNTIVFRLRVGCRWNPEAGKDESDPNIKYQIYELPGKEGKGRVWRGANVLASYLTPELHGRQVERYSTASSMPRPVQGNILLAKLRPGQIIDVECHCFKGIGKDHAKFSPVATATYRLLPTITILGEPIRGAEARLFQKCFSPGVVDIVTGEDGVEEAVVRHARNDTVSREVLRHAEFEGRVRLGRVRDHFIFQVESTGIIPPERLLPQAIKVLQKKCRKVKAALEKVKV